MAISWTAGLPGQMLGKGQLGGISASHHNHISSRKCAFLKQKERVMETTQLPNYIHEPSVQHHWGTSVGGLTGYCCVLYMTKVKDHCTNCNSGLENCLDHTLANIVTDKWQASKDSPRLLPCIQIPFFVQHQQIHFSPPIFMWSTWNWIVRLNLQFEKHCSI